MAIKTPGGFTPAQVTAAGVKNFSGALSAADLIASFGDAYGPAMYCLPAGVVAGCECTASGLDVTIPSGSIWFARQVWVLDAASVETVPDSATTYLWGCSDGDVRQTTSTTPPTSFTAYTACIIAKVTATGGTATVDNLTKHWALGSDIGGLPFGVGAISGAIADSNYTVLAAAYRYPIIEAAFSGWSTGRNLVMPLIRGMARTVVNTCGQAVTVIGASGTGVTIADDRAARVYCDGTNWVRLSADSVLT